MNSEAFNIMRTRHTIDKESLRVGRGKIYLLKIRPIEITSTEIRNKILEGKDVSEFLFEDFKLKILDSISFNGFSNSNIYLLSIRP